jgi:hypothetical protein
LSPFLKREPELLIPCNLNHREIDSLQELLSTRLLMNCTDPSECKTAFGGLEDNRLHDGKFVDLSLANSDITSGIGKVHATNGSTQD